MSHCILVMMEMRSESANEIQFMFIDYKIMNYIPAQFFTDFRFIRCHCFHGRKHDSTFKHPVFQKDAEGGSKIE